MLWITRIDSIDRPKKRSAAPAPPKERARARRLVTRAVLLDDQAYSKPVEWAYTSARVNRRSYLPPPAPDVIDITAALALLERAGHMPTCSPSKAIMPAAGVCRYAV